MEEKLKQKSGNLIKVVLLGPESTGKTTLARSLATYYNTECVPEYMREYLQRKWDLEMRVCEPEDMPPIAVGQMEQENSLAEKANELLICDTNLLELKVYSEAYYNEYCDEQIEKYAIQNFYDLYLLTYVDVPWVQDDLRDKPLERDPMFLRFKNALDKFNKPYRIIKGSRDQRFKSAIQHIDKLIK
ncbi:nicotinamide-nucleotide adenylyltransferase, NadR type [Zhouia amylolytica]|uniref:Nicotinamide-nucleotide adenylyltransferase, NadR type n=1 Tax=Zhouia amylolytica TaxID=376730 RepID=A0A1I6SJE9_9FLAO|nr:ATP-binding protein [Zhouia amylolytica]SFS77067.1 nicotinamide-nucleotide adenylyltransferase, NadR type [Zhouia amylolytica]